MRYLITHPDHKPFYSSAISEGWVEGTTVFDLLYHCYTTDGDEWYPIAVD